MDGIFLISLKEARLHGNYERGLEITKKIH